MQYAISELIRKVHTPPINEVRGWIAGRSDDDLPLLDLCQAVPDYPPAKELNEHLAELVHDPLISKYSPDEGLPEVLAAICGYYRRKYGALMTPSNLCLTIGASQAFWLAIVTLCRAGDEVVVQAPYYFDHAMALDMLGIKGVYAPFEEANCGLPSPEVIDSLITAKTRAILLVSPSNPTGVITSPELLEELHNLACRRGVALIVDETYNEFIPGGGRPHDLFIHPEWGGQLVHLASFGKSFALTGYRAGLLAASEDFIQQALKVQDTMAVCQPRITQQAVKFGVEHLHDWVAAKRDMMTERHDLFRQEFSRPGNAFQLTTSGAFFGWVRHPFDGLSGRQVAKRLVEEAGILCLPGEVFGPGLESYLRLAFGNLPADMIPEAVRRFRDFT
ncbi:MAG TPA: aminotransferase [Desulfuromonadaceae bacterium]|jgi:aspartate/methionine/tyrosine aminotransferase